MARINRGHRLRAIALPALALLAVALPVVFWTVHQADQRMRSNLRVQARLAAQSVSIEDLAALTGTPADLDLPAYRRIKGQLTRLWAAAPGCRFIYLLGRRPDGAIFFYGDSEPPGSKDESPPGQVYEEATTGLRAVFISGNDDTEGPVSDRWGRWVSAFIPLKRAHPLAVFGMDIDASDWWVQVASRCMVPAGAILIAVLTGCLCSLLVSANRRGRASAAALEERLAFERVVADLSSRFVAPFDLNAQINDSLRAIGTFSAADRAYLFLVRDDGTVVDNTHEWCAEGIAPHIANLQGVSCHTIPWWMAKLTAGEAINVENVSGMSAEAAREKQILEAQDIRSLLVVPMAVRGRLMGFLGFDSVRRRRIWSEDNIALLRMAGETAARALARHRANRDLEQALEKIRTIESVVERGPGVLFLWRNVPTEWPVEFVTRNVERILGHSVESLVSGRVKWPAITHPDDVPALEAHVADCLSRGVDEWSQEYRLFDGQGRVRWVRDWNRAIRNAQGEITHVQAIVLDVTEQREAEAEKDRLQAQFLHAQKMESVGRLAGGVAHDFNNLLTGIMGYVEIARERLEPDHPIRTYLDEIAADARRSADLTRQLLAFARKQIIAPRTLNLNDAIEGMLKLLRRLVGENVHVIWSPGPELWLVKMDRSQVEQLLANLAVNARDAVSGSGKITVGTANARLDAAFCAENPGCVPGEYVQMSVSDDGCGMSAETLSHLFEPFFTTKGMGHGTGLGLATVFGIVKQNAGYVKACSELGKGTTFTIYLPRLVGSATLEESSLSEPVQTPRGSGTVLLAEDEKSLRVTTRLFLEALGYTVLAAENAAEALALAEKFAGEIHLLLTDVVMPGMGGRDLANRLLAARPNVKVLFISGYPADVVVHHGVLDDGVSFLAKPFTRDELARKMRQVLAPEPAPGAK